MCGIVGYLGKKDSVPIILDGLHRLEYRGYDSAGIAVMEEGEIQFIKNFSQKINSFGIKVLSFVFSNYFYNFKHN